MNISGARFIKEDCGVEWYEVIGEDRKTVDLIGVDLIKLYEEKGIDKRGIDILRTYGTDEWNKYREYVI